MKRLLPIICVAPLLALLPAACGGGGGGGGGGSDTGSPFTPGSMPTGPTPRDVVTGDFNGDGNLDVAVANENGDLAEVVSLYTGDGAGNLSSKTGIPPNAPGDCMGPLSLAGGDLDDDTIDDLVILCHVDDTYAVALGSTTTIQAGPAVGLGVHTDSEAVTLGYFDADAILDLAVIVLNLSDPTNPDSLIVYSGDGAGGFSATPMDTVDIGNLSSPWDLAAGDIDGDGDTDIATVALQTAPANENLVTVLMNDDGADTFTLVTGEPRSIVVETDANLAVADLNGDIYDDVVCTIYSTNSVAVFLGNATGELINHTEYAVGVAPTDVAIADVNGDGAQDIVTSNSVDDTVSILSGRGDGTFAGATPVTVPTGPGAVAAADLDGGGEADIFTTHPLSNLLGTLIH